MSTIRRIPALLLSFVKRLFGGFARKRAQVPQQEPVHMPGESFKFRLNKDKPFGSHKKNVKRRKRRKMAKLSRRRNRKK